MTWIKHLLSLHLFQKLLVLGPIVRTNDDHGSGMNSSEKTSSIVTIIRFNIVVSSEHRGHYLCPFIALTVRPPKYTPCPVSSRYSSAMHTICSLAEVKEGAQGREDGDDNLEETRTTTINCRPRPEEEGNGALN